MSNFKFAVIWGFVALGFILLLTPILGNSLAVLVTIISSIIVALAYIAYDPLIQVITDTSSKIVNSGVSHKFTVSKSAHIGLWMLVWIFGGIVVTALVTNFIWDMFFMIGAPVIIIGMLVLLVKYRRAVKMNEEITKEENEN